MVEFIKKLGSVRFTVFISVGLILLLIVSTSMEALKGTPFAQKVFYQTRWFDLLMSLLWVNIFCSTVIRFPFKKNQTGFLITHIGILILLAGALIARAHSVEGQVSVYEGEKADSMGQSHAVLTVAGADGTQQNFELNKGAFSFQKVPFNITAILDHSVNVKQVKAGNGLGVINHAARLKVNARRLGDSGAVWLVEHESGNALSNEAMVGTVRLTMSAPKKTAAAPKPVFRAFDPDGNEILTLYLEAQPVLPTINLAQSGWSVEGLEYYPYASVIDNKLKNNPDGRKLNPAVVFNLVDPNGESSRKVYFAYFPDFESMHAGAKVTSDMKFRLEAGEPGDLNDNYDGLTIALFYTDQDSWSYRVKNKDSVIREGAIKKGDCVSSGYMDVEFCAEDLLNMARVSYSVESDKTAQGPLAVGVVIPSINAADVRWVVENEETPVRLPSGDVTLALTQAATPLPFSITLNQFRKIDYPGTNDPASFESDVVLTDARRGVSLTRTISMNHPLEYDGFKIFQTSYMNDDTHGKGSVFTVAKNPGIPWIYGGSLLALLGALILFYGTKKE
jgi:hypothetical protein